MTITGKAELVTRLCRLTFRTNIADAVDEIEVWRESHLELTRCRQDLAELHAKADDAERVRLLAELVTLGAEKREQVAKERWQSMPLPALREVVADYKAAHRK